MKKGVYDSLIFLFVVVLIFSVSASVLFAITPGDITSTGDDFDLAREIGVTATAPIQTVDDADAGFWKAIVRFPVTAPPSGTVSDTFQLPDRVYTTGGNLFPIEDTYRLFDVTTFDGIPAQEINYVRFVLDPAPYVTLIPAEPVDLELVSTSHGDYPVSGDILDDFLPFVPGGTWQLALLDEYYASGSCLLCNGERPGPDELEGCYYFDFENPRALDATCVEVDILRREDCGEMADYNGMFCEGIKNVGINVGNTLEDGTPLEVSLLSNQGIGGCYEYDEEGYRVDHARDWFVSTEPVARTDYQREYMLPDYGYDVELLPPFSPDFTVNAVEQEDIGRCCGNDWVDMGTLLAWDVNYENFFACVNTSTGGRWAVASSNDDAFVVHKIVRPVVGSGSPPPQRVMTYDMVSNTQHFFVCGSDPRDDPFLGNLYLDSSIRRPLLHEYETLPARTNVPMYGMTRGEPTGAGPEGGAYDRSSASDCTTCEGASVDDLVDEDVFEQDIAGVEDLIRGVTEADMCDQDGDGFDGNWSTDPIYPLIFPDDWPEPGEDSPYRTDQHPGGWFNPGLDCVPQQPFDCDDSDASVNPSATDYCDLPENFNEDCNRHNDCIPRPPTGPEEGEPVIYPEYGDMIDRFMCHDIDGYGAFAECCGWDYTHCHNSDRGRREGSAIHTLMEFTSRDTEGVPDRGSTNQVLRYGIAVAPDDPETVDPDAHFFLLFPYTEFDEPVYNWARERYRSLEFDIYFTTNYELELWVGFLPEELRLPQQVDNMNNYLFPFKARVVDYVVGEPRLRKWLHVVIPMDEIYNGYEYEIGSLVFASNIKRQSEMRSVVHLEHPIVDARSSESASTFSNVIGMDKVILRPELDSDENYYCTGTWPPVWIDDLDETDTGDTDRVSRLDEPPGRSACNAIPSFTWTGNYCCGDDNGNDVTPYVKGQLAFKEFYNDVDGACWAGRYAANGERMMLLEFGMSYIGLDEDFEVSCSAYNCTYPLPPRAGVIVENPHADTYNMYFADEDGVLPIGAGAVSRSATSVLKASSIPLQVQYFEGDFYTCNGEDYLFDIPDTSTDDAFDTLLVDSPEYRMESCQVMGNYFCDHELGKDRGWDDESLRVFTGPFPEITEDDLCYDEEGDGLCDYCIDEDLNLMCDSCLDTDGDSYCDDCVDVEEPFMECDDAYDSTGGLVAATERDNIKGSYNLVLNGGFENV